MYVLWYCNLLKCVNLFVVNRLSDWVHIDTIYKEQSHHAVFDGFGFYILILIYFVNQSKLGLFVNFPQSALQGGLPLINFTLCKVQFVYYFVAWVVVYDKQNAVQLLVKN